MERCVELSYFLGVKFSRLGYRWMGGREQRKSGSCQDESWFSTVEEKDQCHT